MEAKASADPIAFLCHAGEDNELAHRLGRDLFANGIRTFVDEWEIGAGDSLRQKIDGGLLDCTHFLALLTPVSLTKEWVKAELDAAYVEKIQGRCKLVCLRQGLPIEQVPPLLKGAWCPSIENYETDFEVLLGHLYGVSRRPPLGERPAWTEPDFAPKLGLSPLAAKLIGHLVTNSVNGLAGDPSMDPSGVRELIARPDSEIGDAVDDLERFGLVEKLSGIGGDRLGFFDLSPTEQAFINLDSLLMPWNTLDDARTVASVVNESQGQYRNMRELGPALGWNPRRLNPPACLLVNEGILESVRVCGAHPYAYPSLSANRRTARFLRGE